jgi:sulfur-oxidizing protein SoxY
MDRRTMLKYSGGVLGGLILSPIAAFLPGQALAAWKDLDTNAVPPVQGFDETVKRMFGGRTIDYSEGAIKLIVPNVAENGAVVPVQADLLLPLEGSDYVKKIYFIVEKNKRPLAVTFSFTEDTGFGHAAAYLRMGQTSWIHGIVEMKDGTLIGAKKETKVVVGGCGG